MSALLRTHPLPGVEVHVLDGVPPEEACELLSPEESERATRLRGVGSAYACAHAALRRLVAQRTRREPCDLRFTTGAHGKPHLADVPQLHFSISYRAGCAAIALGRRPVGIDVESLRARVDAEGIARRFFTREEQAWLAASPGPHAFHALWTRKEALVKAAGVGIDGMESAGAHGDTARLVDEHGQPRQYRILQIDPVPGFALALAVEDLEKEMQ